jgi:type II secretory pathway pseudopilin PulG
MTLVELLVAIAIVGILMALLLVGVQAAREAARRATCQNHLRQLALAALQHESAHKHYPAGGWGGTWVGDADRGFGRKQPGGWAYNVLPFLEQEPLHSLGKGLKGPAQAAAIAARVQTPLSVFHCPSRRAARVYPFSKPYTNRPRQSAIVAAGGRSDYAINAGDQERCEVLAFFGPQSLAEGDEPAYEWPEYDPATGIAFLRSTLRAADVEDGTSNVYLLGEKSLSAADYETGADHGDDWSLYTGFQDDLYRGGAAPARPDPGGAEGYTPRCGFGSAHSGGWAAAFCDGSVRLVSYAQDAETHRSLSNRYDGTPGGSGD